MFQKGSNDISDGLSFLDGKIDSLSGVFESSPVIQVGSFRGVLVFIKAAFGPVGTAVAGAGRPVSAGTFERDIFRAVRGALSAMNTFAVIGAFQRQFTFVCKGPVETDFLADGGFIFADGQRNSSFGRTVGNTRKDDTSFLKG